MSTYPVGPRSPPRSDPGRLTFSVSLVLRGFDSSRAGGILTRDFVVSRNGSHHRDLTLSNPTPRPGKDDDHRKEESVFLYHRLPNAVDDPLLFMAVLD